MILYFATIYAKNIYPLLPLNYGGGKPTKAIIYKDIDTIYCKILNENNDWLLMKECPK